jgi:hypothetical protein
MATIGDEIRDRIEDNLKRVRNLASQYTAASKKRSGRRAVSESDLLRAAVVLLHATFENLPRNLASPDFLTGASPTRLIP